MITRSVTPLSNSQRVADWLVRSAHANTYQRSSKPYPTFNGGGTVEKGTVAVKSERSNPRCGSSLGNVVALRYQPPVSASTHPFGADRSATLSFQRDGGSEPSLSRDDG